MNDKKLEKELDIYMKVLSWSHLNFDLQNILNKKDIDFDENLKDSLKKVSYYGTCVKTMQENEKDELFIEDGFFSASQTGNRIISYILIQIGLDKNLILKAEDALSTAYDNIQDKDKKSTLLDKTYQHTKDTLYVFS